MFRPDPGTPVIDYPPGLKTSGSAWFEDARRSPGRFEEVGPVRGSPRVPAVAALAAATLTTTALAACSKSPDTPSAPPPSAAGNGPRPSATPTAAVHPFTGARASAVGPVLAVKIDNTRSAKPQYGLRSAD